MVSTTAATRRCGPTTSASMAVALEDYSQIETGGVSTFVGVYDGHGGPDAARYVSRHLFPNLMRFARENGMISEEVVRQAVSATEDGFLAHVRRAREISPLIQATGSCCLAGVICRGSLYIANLGDSRAVLGSLSGSGTIIADQLNPEHNASMEEVRRELHDLHVDDPNIVVLKHGVWPIKGLIQVSRSIGDAFLKSQEFSLDPIYSRFGLPEPLRRPVLTAEPSIHIRALRPQDRFLIFASDGLWEHFTNQEAAEVVHKHPRRGIARRLVRRALQAASGKRNIKYADLKAIGKSVRRSYHDDITVVVVFIDFEQLSRPHESIQIFVDAVGPSDISVLDVANMSSSAAGPSDTSALDAELRGTLPGETSTDQVAKPNWKGLAVKDLWSNVSSEILWNFLDRLHILDHLQFRGVCKSWQIYQEEYWQMAI